MAALPLVLVAPPTSDQIPLASRHLHERAIVVDGHADMPQRMLDGLNPVFFSVWMPGTIMGSAVAVRALAQIKAVRNAVRTHPTGAPPLSERNSPRSAAIVIRMASICDTGRTR